MKSFLRPWPFALLAALALAYAATISALHGGPGFGALRLGPWTSWPKLGNLEIDPYARAVVAVEGALPLGAGEGLAFIARTDQSGAPLDARCDYEISGAAPPGRFWTLAAYDLGGRLLANPSNRYGLTSAGLLRATDGSYSVIAARQARPGNWLPLGEKSRFLLILRAYPFSTGATSEAFDGLAMPSIVRGACS